MNFIIVHRNQLKKSFNGINKKYQRSWSSIKVKLRNSFKKVLFYYTTIIDPSNQISFFTKIIMTFAN